MFKKLNVPFIVFELAFYGIFTALIFTLGSKDGHGNTSFIIAYVMMGVFAFANIFVNLVLAKKHTGENAITDFGLFYPAELAALFVSFGIGEMRLLIKLTLSLLMSTRLTVAFLERRRAAVKPT